MIVSAVMSVWLYMEETINEQIRQNVQMNRNRALAKRFPKGSPLWWGMGAKPHCTHAVVLNQAASAAKNNSAHIFERLVLPLAFARNKFRARKLDRIPTHHCVGASGGNKTSRSVPVNLYPVRQGVSTAHLLFIFVQYAKTAHLQITFYSHALIRHVFVDKRSAFLNTS